MKFAEGVQLDAVASLLRKVLEPHQLSVRTPGAVEAIVRGMRQWTCMHPDRTLVELDLTNAYGNAYRSSMMRATRLLCPPLAAGLAAAWAPGGSTAWIRTECGWEAHAVQRGTWQGSPLSNPILRWQCMLR